MKKLFYFFLILISVLFIVSINVFLNYVSNSTHIISTNIILGLYFGITIVCLWIVHHYFQKNQSDSFQNFRKNIKIAFSNAFIISSIVSILFACIIYTFLKNILEIVKLENGMIQYCLFASKIWFISSPFIRSRNFHFSLFFYYRILEKAHYYFIFKIFCFLDN